MKVPLSTIQSCNSSRGKPISCNITALITPIQIPSSSLCENNNNNNNNYEPTSVLDLQRSPSPAPNTAAPPPSNTGNHHHHPPPTVDLDNSEAWDSILSELGLNDDSTPNSKLSLVSQIGPCFDIHLQDFPSSPINLPSDYINICDNSSYYNRNINNNFGSPSDRHHGLNFIDDLIRAAQCFESNDYHQVHLILGRLNQRQLTSPTGKPLRRAAFYFKETLHHLATSPTRPSSRLSSYEVVQTIRAHKAFSVISPISLFSTFTANQAILEAVDGSNFIHIVDFDIGFGGHWASFMRELVDRSKMSSSIVLRITAIVPEEEFGIESKLVKENLSQFAKDLNINFQIEYVMIHDYEILSFKSVKFIDGEKLAVHLSPSVFHRLGNSRSGISKFLADLRGISPSTVVVVVVDKEVGIDIGTESFSANFMAAIEFYTEMLESLDVAAAAGGFVGGEDCVRMIETFVLRPKIVAVVEAAAAAIGRRTMTWREMFVAAGMKAVGFSQFADFQAECLLRRSQIGGHHVAKCHGEMMLFWHGRPLAATSAWRC